LLGPYAASKFAVEGLSDALRRELRPWGIQVTVIEPGAIKTRIWEKGRIAGDAMLEHAPVQAESQYGPLVQKVRAESGAVRDVSACERCPWARPCYLPPCFAQLAREPPPQAASICAGRPRRRERAGRGGRPAKRRGAGILVDYDEVMMGDTAE
jgi:NAD(P)-dependent dehydrogenase (short-subunit alcohol dehydrogenase family)